MNSSVSEMLRYHFAYGRPEFVRHACSDHKRGRLEISLVKALSQGKKFSPPPLIKENEKDVHGLCWGWCSAEWYKVQKVLCVSLQNPAMVKRAVDKNMGKIVVSERWWSWNLGWRQKGHILWMRITDTNWVNAQNRHKPQTPVVH